MIKLELIAVHPDNLVFEFGQDILIINKNNLFDMRSEKIALVIGPDHTSRVALKGSVFANMARDEIFRKLRESLENENRYFILVH